MKKRHEVKYTEDKDAPFKPRRNGIYVSFVKLLKKLNVGDCVIIRNLTANTVHGFANKAGYKVSVRAIRVGPDKGKIRMWRLK